MKRAVFFLSDCTGLTTESMGKALISQFKNVDFSQALYPFIATTKEAEEIAQKINETSRENGNKSLIFASIINKEIMDIFHNTEALSINFFESFLPSLKEELQIEPEYSVARIRGINDREIYDARMEAVNFSLNHDDGISDKELSQADVILLGVSRCGKTPTCLYLAMQYGLRAANYPLTEEDLESTDLPRMVKPYKNKLFGLTIQAERLQAIRHERRPNSRYSTLSTCISELRDAQAIYRAQNIPFVNTTDKSVEELAAYIVQFFNFRK